MNVKLSIDDFPPQHGRALVALLQWRDEGAIVDANDVVSAPLARFDALELCAPAGRMVLRVERNAGGFRYQWANGWGGEMSALDDGGPPKDWRGAILDGRELVYRAVASANRMPT